MWDENDLIKLGSYLSNAIEDLRAAQRIAEDLCGADPERDDPGWPAMGELVDKLDAINRLLAVLPSQEIRDAIKGAADELDRLSDLADGQSY